MARRLSSRYGIHWFRRDLRGVGNWNLLDALARADGAVLGLFLLEPDFRAAPDFSADRLAYTLQTLLALRAELRARGGDLLVLVESATSVFSRWNSYCDSAALARPSFVSFSREYEPLTRKRDAAVLRTLSRSGIEAFSGCDHLLLEPHDVLKDDGTFYKVYSPFARRWFRGLNSPSVRARVETALTPLPRFSLSWVDFSRPRFPFRDALDGLIKDVVPSVPLPPAGFLAARKAVHSFVRQMAEYDERRNLPAAPGTSKLSIFLRQGALTPAQILKLANLENAHFLARGGGAQFVRELAWREFYHHVLFHRPDVARTTFVRRYAGLKWSRSPKAFARWCEGQTGFPLVDAAMRQLNQTGWMHNRMRMVVSSFLVKDLLLDYRLGERYFMRRLLDYELASNNGGWQWAASTGVDPQPYFRIFNPWLQAKKFDPEGLYTKCFVPELKSAPPRDLLRPEADRKRYGYPRPMVLHERQKDRVLEIYRSAPVISPEPPL